jgi:hypothetical protein
VTRSPVIIRDLDLLTELARHASVTVCISIATIDADLAREIEPTVALPVHRLRTVRQLSEAGIRAGVLLAPILPGITDTPESLDAVVHAAREHGAHFVGHNVLHLGDVTRDAFFRFLSARHPGLVPRYQRMYRGKYAPDAYRADMSDIVEASKKFHGIESRRHVAPPAEPAQLTLFTQELSRRRVQRTAARRRAAARTAGGVPRRFPVQVDMADHSDAHGPRQHIGELRGERLPVAAPQRLGDFPDLFDEAPERTVDAARPVSLAERRSDLLLQDPKIHMSPLTNGGSAGRTA